MAYYLPDFGSLLNVQAELEANGMHGDSDDDEGSELDEERISFAVCVVQEPQRGRAVDFLRPDVSSAKLSPPPIFQLTIADADGYEMDIGSPWVLSVLDRLIARVTLVSPDGNEDRSTLTVAEGDGRLVSSLWSGSIQSVSHLVRGGARCAFFIFPDLTMRPLGEHALRLDVFLLSQLDHSKSHLVASCLTGPFIIYGLDFPGIAAMTELSSEFAAQGHRGLGRRAFPLGDLDLSDNEGDDEGSWSP